MFQNTSKYHHFSPSSFHQFGGPQNSDSQGTISLSLGQFGVCISGFKQDPHLVPIPTGYLSQGTPRPATVHHWGRSARCKNASGELQMCTVFTGNAGDSRFQVRKRWSCPVSVVNFYPKKKQIKQIVQNAAAAHVCCQRNGQ